MNYKILLILGGLLLVGGGCKNIKKSAQIMSSIPPVPAEQNNQGSDASNTRVMDTHEDHISEKAENFSLFGLGRIYLPAGLQVSTTYNEINKTYWSARIQNYQFDRDGVKGLGNGEYFIEFSYTEDQPFNKDMCDERGYEKGVPTTFLSHSGLYCTERRAGGETFTGGYGYILETPRGTLGMSVYGNESSRGLQSATALIKGIVWMDKK